MSLKTKSALVTSFAAASVLALPATAFATTTAQDAGAKAAKCKANGSSDANWLIPDGEGSWAGRVFWHDYGYGKDLDNFLIDDRNLDAQSSSLWVKNNYTGKTYYKHAYNGNAYCMSIGSLPKGKTASWKACGWNGGTKLECRSGKVTE